MPRKPIYTRLTDCLEDTDKDLRRFLLLDTKCYYPPGFEPVKKPSEIDCKLDPSDAWTVPAGCPSPKCTTFETTDAWNIGVRNNQFGWALKVRVPDTIPSVGWTIVLRVPKQDRGVFESWVSEPPF